MKFRNPQNERGKTNAASWFNFPGNKGLPVSIYQNHPVCNNFISIVMLIFLNFSAL